MLKKQTVLRFWVAEKDRICLDEPQNVDMAKASPKKVLSVGM